MHAYRLGNLFPPQEADLALAMMVPSNARDSAARHTALVYADEVAILAGKPSDGLTDSTYGFLLAFEPSVRNLFSYRLLTFTMVLIGNGAGGVVEEGIRRVRDDYEISLKAWEIPYDVRSNVLNPGEPNLRLQRRSLAVEVSLTRRRCRQCMSR